MPINVLPNLILPMFTLRHVSSYFAVDRQMACQCRQVRHYLKTYIPRHIKPLVPLDHQALNGEPLLLSSHLQAHQSDQQETGEDDLLRSTHRLSHQIHTISLENNLEAQFLLRHVLQVHDKSSK